MRSVGTEPVPNLFSQEHDGTVHRIPGRGANSAEATARCSWASRRRRGEVLLNSPGPAAIRGTPAVLGRSQVVRHRILIPAFPGSNPGAPANHSGRQSSCGFISTQPGPGSRAHSVQERGDRPQPSPNLFVDAHRLRRDDSASEPWMGEGAGVIQVYRVRPGGSRVAQRLCGWQVHQRAAGRRRREVVSRGYGDLRQSAGWPSNSE
jgi:hypothetical protein